MSFLTVALGFLFQPDVSIASTAELSDLNPDLGLPTVLTLVGSMGGSLGSDLRFSYPCQLDEVVHAASNLKVMSVRKKSEDPTFEAAHARCSEGVGCCLNCSLLSQPRLASKHLGT
jgi:hypothetical protein